MLLADFINGSISRLAPLYPVKEARSIVLMICAHFIGTKSYTHIVDPEYGIPESKLPVLEEGVERLSAGEPVQYVIGEAEFYDHKFRVTPDVLIPRPETEQLYELAAQDCDSLMQSSEDDTFSILDMCCGSGCLTYAFAAEFPEAHVYGCDISDAALGFACRQRVKLQGAHPVIFKADVQGEPPAGLPKFDLIVSNPPYVREVEKEAMRPNVLDWEPSLALFVPDDDPLKYYRAIALWAVRFLAPGGFGIVEINEALGAECAALFENAGLANVKIQRDFRQKERFVSFLK